MHDCTCLCTKSPACATACLCEKNTYAISSGTLLVEQPHMSLHAQHCKQSRRGMHNSACSRCAQNPDTRWNTRKRSWRATSGRAWGLGLAIEQLGLALPARSGSQRGLAPGHVGEMSCTFTWDHARMHICMQACMHASARPTT